MITYLFISMALAIPHGVFGQRNVGDTCRTPLKSDGTCQLLTGCQPLLKLLQKRPYPVPVQDFLRQSQCGFADTIPIVCCPSSGVTGLEDNIDSGRGWNNAIPVLDGCGKTGPLDRIVGGTLTELGEFPWMALIEYSSSNAKNFGCGGVLINSRYVLTAAHCVTLNAAIRKTWRLSSVRLGEHTISTPSDCNFECADDPVDVPVESTIIHNLYDQDVRNQKNDIALLRLSRDVTFTDYIRPICLPTLKSELINNTFANEYLIIAGWGRTETAAKSDVLLKLEVPGVTIDSCKKTYRSLSVNLGKSQICAGGLSGQDSCNGDSGGPLMYKNNDQFFVVGIASFGPNVCGTENWPGVYTRVSEYANWISRNVAP